MSDIYSKEILLLKKNLYNKEDSAFTETAIEKFSKVRESNLNFPFRASIVDSCIPIAEIEKYVIKEGDLYAKIKPAKGHYSEFINFFVKKDYSVIPYIDSSSSILDISQEGHVYTDLHVNYWKIGKQSWTEKKCCDPDVVCKNKNIYGDL